MIIQTDATLTGWEAACVGVQRSRQWSGEERTLHINVLELLAIKLALFSCTNRKSEKHTLSDKQQGSLLLPFKNGGNKE